ncbi:MAG: hypothetical protein WCG08_12175 [Paludibacter sp.]
MNLIRNINRVEKLHSLILQEKTGNPKQLAEQLGICRATLYILIEELNALNMPVAYSRKYETFYYEKDVKLTLAFKVEVITDKNELRKINGGNSNFFLPSILSDGRNIPLYSYLAEYKSQFTGL